jgi:pyruvate dehydrogenase complex dehydrogenase (E1) component
MDPVIALYTVLLATVLGLSGFARSDTRRRGRGLLLASVLAGFIVVAAVSALVIATTIPGMIVTALAVLFSAQAATTALSLLWREIHTETRPPVPASKAGTEDAL